MMFEDGQVTLTPSERSPLKNHDQGIQLFGQKKEAEIEGSGLKEKRKKLEEESEENQLKEKGKNGEEENEQNALKTGKECRRRKCRK